MTAYTTTIFTGSNDNRVIVCESVFDAASAGAAIKMARALAKEQGWNRHPSIGTLHFRAKKGATASAKTAKEQAVSRLAAEMVAKQPKAKKAATRAVSDQPMTDLEFKLFDIYAHCEMTAANGATPEAAGDIWTYLWADERAKNMGISEKAVGGLLTSLQAKGFARVEAPSKQDKDGGFWATEAGFTAWAAMRAARA